MRISTLYWRVLGSSSLLIAMLALFGVVLLAGGLLVGDQVLLIIAPLVGLGVVVALGVAVLGLRAFRKQNFDEDDPTVEAWEIAFKYRHSILAIGLFMMAMLTGLIAWMEYRSDVDDRLNQRLSEATALLSSDDEATVIRGIYALEAVAERDSQHYPEVVESLTLFIRTRSPWPRGSRGEPEVAASVQAAIQVIGRAGAFDGRQIDLSGSDLRRLDLSRLDLHDVDFFASNLLGVRARGTDFTGADFTSALITEDELCDGALLGDNGRLPSCRVEE